MRLLARAGRLDPAAQVALVLLVAASTARYLVVHGTSDRAPAVLAGAVALLLAYAAGFWLRRTPVSEALWLAVVLAVWGLLLWAAPSFAWCAVPLAFTALRVLPFPWAGLVISGQVLGVAAAWSRVTNRFDPTLVVGPACVAALAVIAYRALVRAQDALAAEQRRAGALAERARVSRDLHDSVAQGLSSVNLLLRAAEQEWQSRPDAARQHVGRAAEAARDALDEARRVVLDLAPRMDGGLVAALREVVAALPAGDLDVRLDVHGEPVPLDDAVAGAIVLTARGALANVVEHAHATRAVVTLTYDPASVALDVRDDGGGIRGTPRPGRGRGLAGIRERVGALGGVVSVESDDGTALAVSIPVAAP